MGRKIPGFECGAWTGNHETNEAADPLQQLNVGIVVTQRLIRPDRREPQRNKRQ